MTVDSLRNRIKIVFILIFFAFFLCNKAYCQHWQNLGAGVNGDVRCFYSDTTENVLFVGGQFTKAGGITTWGIAKWDGFEWDSVGSGALGMTNVWPVNSIIRYHGEIYAGGMGPSDQRGGIAKWNGTNWELFEGGVNGTVSNLLIYNNELYVCGMFDSVGNILANGLAKWNGNSWSDVHSLPDYFTPGINAIGYATYYKDELYICGNFHGPDSMRSIAKWNGTNWQDVGGGFYGAFGSAGKMVEYKNKLYVSGAFSKTEDARNPGNYIAAWDGNNWSDVGGGVIGDGGGNGQIWDINVYNDELYVVGVFKYAGGISAEYIAKWDGEKWCGLGSSFDNILTRVSVFQDMLYIGGGFSQIDNDSIPNIAKWTGGNYVDACGSISSIEQLQTDNHKLIIYPNPFTTNLTFQLPETLPDINLSLYDVYSRLVSTTNASNTNKITLQNTALPKGIYIYRITSKNTVVKTGKVIKN